MTPSRRTLLAAAVAPLVPTSLLLLAQLLGRPRLGLPAPIFYYVLMGFAVGGYVLSYASGIPIYLVLHRLRWTGWYAYMAGAFVAGAVLALLWAAFRDPSWPMADLGFFSFETSFYVSVYALGFIIGMLMAVIGLLFWLIARPDRSLE